MKRNLLTLAASATVLGAARADVIGLVDFDGTETGLTAYTNPIVTFTGTGLGTNANQVSSGVGGSSTWAAGDSFWPMTRAAVGPNTIGMPFNISDDSVSGAAGNTVFATDVLGFAGMALDTDGFFGITDTENSLNTGPVTATFTFDISGASNLEITVDIAAMGDFENAPLLDFLTFEVDIDGGGFAPVFTSTVDDTISQNYVMDNATPVVVDDPMLINGTLLTDVYQTFSAAIAGSGSTLTVRVTSATDGAEGFGFDNLCINGDSGSQVEFCNGDGGNQVGCTDCPCGNNAPVGTVGGCLNSAATSARLVVSGTPDVTTPADTLHFDVLTANPTTFGILTSGDNRLPNNAANPCFGLDSGVQSAALDGLRCVGSGVLRHGSRSSDVNGDIGITTNGWGPPNNPAAGLGVTSGFIAGQTRHFQVFYREGATAGCMTGQNTTQGITVTFL